MQGYRNEERAEQDGRLRGLAAFSTRNRNEPLRQIEDYWNVLRGGRQLPLRSDLDPREFKGALRHCFSLEWIAPGKAEFRVAGSHLAELMSRDMRGVPISEFLTAECQQEFCETLAAVGETPATASILLTAENGLGGVLHARMNLLPVASEMDDRRRAIGALVAYGERGHAPYRFRIEEINSYPILSCDATRSKRHDRMAATTIGLRSGSDERAVNPGVKLVHGNGRMV